MLAKALIRWTLFLGIALVAVPAPLMAAPTIAIAEASVSDLSGGIETAYRAGLAATDPLIRRSAFRQAREQLVELSRIADQSKPSRPDRTTGEAQAAIQLLETAGISAALLASLDFDASLAVYNALPNTGEEAAGELVGLDQIAHDLADPVRRVAAYVAIGRAQLLRQEEARLRRYAAIAVDELALVEPTSRIAAASPILDLMVDAGPRRFRGLVSRVVGLVLDAPARSAISTRLAMANLTAEQQALAPDGRFSIVKAMLAKPDGLADATELALSVPAGPVERKQALDVVLTAALAQKALPVALRIALGRIDNTTQSRDLRSIIDSFIDAGLPIRVMDVPALFIDPAQQALAHADLGADLARRGYLLISKSAFQAAAAAAERAADPLILGRVAELAGQGGDIETAQALLDRLPTGLLADKVRASLAVEAATRKEPVGALLHLNKIIDARTAAETGAALGLAFLRQGDRVAAEERWAALTDRLIAEPLTVALAGAAAEAGDPDAYRKFLAALPPESASALEVEAAALGRPAFGTADPIKMLDRARFFAGNGQCAALVAVTKGLVRSGQRERALTALDNPVERCDADDLVEAIAREDLRRGATVAAVVLATRLRDPARNAAMLVEVTEAEAAAGGVRLATARLRSLPDYRERVRGFRQIAEAQARRLDRYDLLDASPTTPDEPAMGKPPAGAQEVARTDQINVVRLNGAALAETRPSLPNLNIRAADIRLQTPPLKAGITDLSLARLNRFNAKFFEDIVGTSARDYLFNAQTNINPTYVFLSQGVFTLSQIEAQLNDGGGWEIETNGSVVTLRVPLVVGPNATLVMSGAEAKEYRISSSSGAFIVNAGSLYVVDTVLTAYDEKTGKPAFADYEHKTKFRPFITAWSDSRTYIAGSHLIAFGYSAGKTYGLSFTTGPRDLVRLREDSLPPTGILVDNSFDQMLYGYYSYEAESMSIIGNEYRDNVVYGIDPHDRSRDLRIAFNTAYGSQKKHGIIISREVDDSLIVGNLSFGNEGSGIMLDRSSVGNLVYANASLDNKQDGLSLFESGCNLIVANRAADNRRSGIRIRNSANVGVAHNELSDNDAAGIEAYVTDLRTNPGGETRDFDLDPFEQHTTLTIAWNTITANGAGIALRGTAEAVLAENVFLRQVPKIYAGDLQDLRVRMLRFGAENTPLRVATCEGGLCTPPDSGPALLDSKLLSPGRCDRQPAKLKLKPGALPPEEEE